MNHFNHWLRDPFTSGQLALGWKWDKPREIRPCPLLQHASKPFLMAWFTFTMGNAQRPDLLIGFPFLSVTVNTMYKTLFSFSLFMPSSFARSFSAMLKWAAWATLYKTFSELLFFRLGLNWHSKMTSRYIHASLSPFGSRPRWVWRSEDLFKGFSLWTDKK